MNGGGVLLYLHESLPAISCVPLMDFNSLWCSITLKDNERLLIGIVYRSPSSSEENNRRLLLLFEVLVILVSPMLYLLVILMFQELIGRTQFIWEVNHLLLLIYLMLQMMLTYFSM